MSSPGWMDRAACIGTDPEAFFPDSGDNATARLAKRVCARCEVRPECLADALESGDVREGIRGGMAPRERQALTRRCRRGAALESAA